MSYRRYSLLVVLSVLASCKRHDQAVSDRAITSAAGDAQRVAAGDLDSDGHPEIVLVDAKHLRVIDRAGRERARRPAAGGVQVLRVADIDGDGRGEILAGWGQTRDHPDAAARISVVRLDGDSLVEELVSEPETSRAQIVAILPMTSAASEPVLLVAHFASKYMVRIATARRDERGWTLSPIDTIRMATSVALGDLDGDGETDLLVGRVYGDRVDDEGDAFLRLPDGARIPIPVTGGVRSLAVADLGGDGRSAVLIGDGWNKRYGQLARARLARAWWSDGSFHSELVEDSVGQYTLWDILPVDLDGDGALEIVTRGSAEVRVLSRDGERWSGTTVASGCRDATAVDLDPHPGSQLLVLCEDGAEVIRR